MIDNVQPSLRQRLIWTIGTVELDEAAWRLRIADRDVEIEQKPLEIFQTLLHRAGEAVTKAELLESVWPDVIVVESSLPTAIAKLRRALGDQAELVETVPRVGYRLSDRAPVSSRFAAVRPQLNLKAGDPINGVPDWRLESRLSKGDSDDVWRAIDGAGRRRVFKFADSPGRLRQLKREATIARLLGASGSGDLFVLPVGRSFGQLPAWLSFEDVGTDLAEAMAAEGQDWPLEKRLAIVARVARVIASAHAVGVLHMDIKPANILVDGEDVRVIDFGCGAVVGTAPMDLTNLTQTEGDALSSAGIGTALYRAPEIIGGGAPSIAADIYALGLLLFQVCTGDLHSPLVPGWIELVPDLLLRDDIAIAAALRPEDRFASGKILAERLECLTERHKDAEAAEMARREAASLREMAERARVRRPWVVAAGLSLAAGLLASGTATWQAITQRDEAQVQTAISTQISAFLADDLLGRGDPARSGSVHETILEAAQRAEPEINQRFRNAPLVRAQLYHTLARVYEQQTQWAAARKAYDSADEAYIQAEEAVDTPASVSRLQHAFMEALSFEQGSVDRAKTLIAEESARLDKVRSGKASEAEVWLAEARGMVGLAGGDVHAALDEFGLAAQWADNLPDVFDERARNDFHQRHAFTYIRLGDGKAAEDEIRPLLAAQTRLLGPLNPDVLILKMNLGQAFLFQKRYGDAVNQLSEVLPTLRAQLGPDHRLVMQTLAARAQAYGSMGRYREAVEDGRVLFDLSVTGQGMKSFRAVAALSDLATSECRVPDLDSGIEDARKAYQASLEAFGVQSALTQGVGTALAQCLTYAGQYQEASGLLKSVDVQVVSELASDPQWGANVDLALAEIAIGEKHWAEATAKLRSAAQIYTNPDADFFQRQKFSALSAQMTDAGHAL